MCYAYCYTPAFILSVFGMKRDSPWKHYPTGRFLSPIFLWCFQMARVILNIEMDVAFELDLLNNRILLHVVDKSPYNYYYE